MLHALITCVRWNFTVGNMELMLVEGEEGSEGHSCSISDDLQWELHVDTVMGLVYTTRRWVLDTHRMPYSTKRWYTTRRLHVWISREIGSRDSWVHRIYYVVLDNRVR